uniref:Uncharacterized protein n=1 Tax=Panagrolaimus sp. JU765 TaxID=591449 RepID=A0AC34RLH7_9BILA
MSEKSDSDSTVPVPKVTTSRIFKLAELVTGYIPFASGIFKTYKTFKNDPDLQEFSKECNDYVVDQYNQKSPIVKDSINSAKDWSVSTINWSAEKTTAFFIVAVKNVVPSTPEMVKNVAATEKLKPTSKL